MRKIIVICLLVAIEGLLSLAVAQVDVKQEQDTTTQSKAESFLIKRRENAILESLPDLEPDTSTVSTLPLIGDYKPLATGDSIVRLTASFSPDPGKAVLYALVPGMGQIYNRKYWKLPIIYGGFIGLTYAVSWNGGMYTDYSKAYKDLATGSGDSWKNFIAKSDLTPSERQSYESLLKRQKDYFRRNRDLAIIGSVALYALCIIDAYVDAQLYDFDVSPDLSMRIEPVMYEPTLHTSRSFGIKCSVSF